jgi:acyl-CoA synthetase (NDP forming)
MNFYTLKLRLNIPRCCGIYAALNDINAVFVPESLRRVVAGRGAYAIFIYHAFKVLLLNK